MLSVPQKSNSGSKAKIVFTIACVIYAGVTGPGTRHASPLDLRAAALDGAAEDAVDLAKILKGVEEHYNRTQTLQVSFAEIFTMQGRKRTEKGDLYLRKPGRMRWQYSTPAGKLFVSDGKYIYSYIPSENRAERINFKETEDMRAPLAFLLGRLNFHDDFRDFRQEPDGRGSLFITAIPKSDKLPYTEATFLVSPDSVIHYIEVKGQEGSVTEFTFEGEKKNPLLSDALFRFTPPPGAEYVDSARQH
jgi:outer membrane lipoprotein carrier protein